MKKGWFLLPVAVFCLGASLARAQGGVVETGCDDSPENPTVVLALVGAAGAGTTMLRARLAAKRAKKQ